MLDTYHSYANREDTDVQHIGLILAIQPIGQAMIHSHWPTKVHLHQPFELQFESHSDMCVLMCVDWVCVLHFVVLYHGIHICSL